MALRSSLAELVGCNDQGIYMQVGRRRPPLLMRGSLHCQALPLTIQNLPF